VIRLAVRVRREDAELVLAELLQLAPSGVEEAQLGELVEYAVYGAPGELPELPDLRAAAGGSLVEIATSELPDDWSERWKRFHRPVSIEPPVRRAGCDPVPGLHVRPPWAPVNGGRDVEEIVIDPGQAFGTGAHATTRMCLELLLELAAGERRRGPLLDIGTGSGVLAIAGARLGFAPVLGLDHEWESVQAARVNAQVNGVEVEVRSLDLRTEPLPWIGDAVQGESVRSGDTHRSRWTTEKAPRRPVVVANLLRPLLLELANVMAVAPGHLLASGLLAEEVDEVVRAFAELLGLRERERRTSGEWAAVWLTSLDDPQLNDKHRERKP
jgi:ribosomal protein L11 methyltransferase